MARRGYRKYVCKECKAESWHHWLERNRAARMRCPACGSLQLDFASAEARKDAISLQRVRVQGHPDMTNSPASAKRKVT